MYIMNKSQLRRDKLTFYYGNLFLVMIVVEVKISLLLYSFGEALERLPTYAK